ncbi:MAG: hypothetical protein JXA83_08160 [Acidimicrobiales bacterium]|nr:hypothetical protein [Acidimicrobiales bacterium]
MTPVRSHSHSHLREPARRLGRPGHRPAPEGAAGSGHTDLLSLARAVQAAAVADDPLELSRTVARLQMSLRLHVESEREVHDQLPPALRAVVFGGQDRVLRLVEAISAHGDDEGECSCLVHGASLVVALRRQAALEAAALHRPTDA